MLVYYQNFRLRETPVGNSNLYGWEIATVLEREFYMDDMLESLFTVDEATHTICKVKELWSKGGFNFTKFICNKNEVSKDTPRKNDTDKHLPEDRAF